MEKKETVESESPVHDAFGLTYASWFLVPRVVLEAMPIEWQRKFVKLMYELGDTFTWEPDCSMQIVFRKRGKYIRVPDHFRNYRYPHGEWLNSIRLSDGLVMEKGEENP